MKVSKDKDSAVRIHNQSARASGQKLLDENPNALSMAERNVSSSVFSLNPEALCQEVLNDYFPLSLPKLF